MSKLRRAILVVLAWYKTPTGVVWAAAVVAAVAALATDNAAFVLMAIAGFVGVLLPYKLQRLSDMSPASGNSSVVELESELAALRAELQIEHRRALQFQQQYGQLTNRISRCEELVGDTAG